MTNFDILRLFLGIPINLFEFEQFEFKRIPKLIDKINFRNVKSNIKVDGEFEFLDIMDVKKFSVYKFVKYASISLDYF
jgi:hypothetical protein